jgi:3-oxoadipate enol-lactonase
VPYANAPGAEVYYEVHGDGEPLLLVHGGGGNHASWFQQVPHFSKSRQVITVDLPGFGLSRVTDGVYDMATHPAAIKAVFDDAALDRASIVTQSLGGYGMLNFVVKNPERVDSYIMVSTLGPIADEVARAHQAGRERVQGLSPADFLLTKDFQKNSPEMVLLFFQLAGFNEAGPGRPQRLQGGLRESVTIEDMRAAITAGVKLTVTEGGADIMAHAPAYQRLRELLPEANVQYIEGAPHSDYWENPERFNATIGAILDGAQVS